MKELTDSVAIGNLQRFVADSTMVKIKPDVFKKTQNKTVAIVGAGPAGLAAAGELLHFGYNVEVFEKRPILGGLLKNGIPAYRLPKNTTETEIRFIEKMGAKIHQNKTIKKINVLLKRFDAVFVATGLCKCARLNVPGSDLRGVYSGTWTLERIVEGRPPQMKGKIVCVIGGGDVAVDAARSVRRLGAESVYVVYRRSWNEMPASKIQVQEAKEEGIEIVFLATSTRIIGKKGRVAGCELVRMRLGRPDNSGRRIPIVVPNSKFKLNADVIIAAVGQITDEEFIKNNPEIRFSNGLIAIDGVTCMTSKLGVFAGGDIVNGGATVVQAVAEGKKAARGIHQYLLGRNSLKKWVKK